MQNQFLSQLLHFSERRLVAKAVAGNSEAFGKLYLNYLDALYRYVYYRVEQDQHTAEDIVETAFTKAYEHIGRFDSKKGTFQAWLYQICRNCVLDYYRSHKRTQPLDHPAVLAKADTKPGPEEQALVKVQYTGVMRALKHLSPGQQEIVTLKYMNELSNTEIAAITGKTEEAIRAIQHRSLVAIRTFLETEVL